jgi:hypothetical protein
MRILLVFSFFALLGSGCAAEETEACCDHGPVGSCELSPSGFCTTHAGWYSFVPRCEEQGLWLAPDSPAYPDCTPLAQPYLRDRERRYFCDENSVP